MINKKTEKGLGLLISVVIVSSIASVIVLTLSTISTRSIQLSIVFENSNKAKAYANACAETALQIVRDSGVFSGNGSLNFSDGTCSYSATNSGGDNMEIESSGFSNDVVRRVEVSTDSLNPEINISLWREVADF